MTKKEKQAVIAKIAGGGSNPPRRKRKARKARGSPQKSVPMAGAAKKRRRNRAKRGGSNMITTAGNQKSFIVPIDEQIELINGSTGFAIAAFSLNPGNPACFPFLSRTAQNYERYEFQGLRFEYRPSASVFATVGAQGFVGITGTMDALQATPSSQAQAEIMYHSPVVETAKPTNLFLQKSFLECELKAKKFVRPTGIIPGGADPHLYDSGQVFFWTNGQANTNQIGEVRVTGHCLLINPVLETSTNPVPQFQVASFQQSNATTNLATGVSTILPMATAGTAGIVIPNNGGSFTPPVGNYIITAQVVFVASGSSTQFNANVQKNAALVPGAGLGTEYQLPTAAYVDWTNAIAPIFVTCNGTDVITLNAQSVFQSGAVTAGGYITFEVV